MTRRRHGIALTSASILPVRSFPCQKTLDPRSQPALFVQGDTLRNRPQKKCRHCQLIISCHVNQTPRSFRRQIKKCSSLHSFPHLGNREQEKKENNALLHFASDHSRSNRLDRVCPLCACTLRTRHGSTNSEEMFDSFYLSKDSSAFSLARSQAL